MVTLPEDLEFLSDPSTLALPLLDSGDKRLDVSLAERNGGGQVAKFSIQLSEFAF